MKALFVEAPTAAAATNQKNALNGGGTALGVTLDATTKAAAWRTTVAVFSEDVDGLKALYQAFRAQRPNGWTNLRTNWADLSIQMVTEQIAFGILAERAGVVP